MLRAVQEVSPYKASANKKEGETSRQQRRWRVFKMGRKRKEIVKREREAAARAWRVTRFSGMTDALCDRVEELLRADGEIEARDLKQLSSILKELMVMQDILPEEEREERLLRVKKLARDLEENEAREVTVTFVSAEEAWKN